jgi:hydrogenase nickel incorporation protein HypB
VVVISKLDLLPHVPFSVERATEDALAVQPDLTVLPVCALTGDGMDAWCKLLEGKRREMVGRISNPSETV